MYKVDIYGGQDPNTGEWTTQYIWQGGPQTRPLTGRSAMQTGFAVNLSGDYDARLLHLRPSEESLMKEVIAKLPPNRQKAASEGEERRRSVVTTPSLSDEAIAPRREGGWDESFAITSNDTVSYKQTLPQQRKDTTGRHDDNLERYSFVQADSSRARGV